MISDKRLMELVEWRPSGKTTTLSAQRDEWQEMASELLALRWRPITETDLPKVGDEVIIAGRFVRHIEGNGWGSNFSKRDWDVQRATHFRPINARSAKEPR